MKEKPQTKYVLVRVEWVDAESDNDWGEEKEIIDWIEKECTINEVGWLICKNKRYVVISNQICYDGDLGTRTKIPRSWIKTIDEVELKKVKSLKK